MANLDATIWRQLRSLEDAKTIHESFTTIYQLTDQLDFYWLLLYYATQAGHRSVVLDILNNTEPYMAEIAHVLMDATLTTCLNEAVRKGNHDMIHIYLKHKPQLCHMEGFIFTPDGKNQVLTSPLGFAVRQDDVATVRVLMEYYSGEGIGEHDWVPLHIACRSSSTGCLAMLLESEKGLAGINVKDDEGWTPMLYAALYHPKAIIPLVQNGADVSAFKRKRGSALHILSNWSVVNSPISINSTSGDPCPTLGRRRRVVQTENDTLYLPNNFVQLAQVLVDAGVDMNWDTDLEPAPLRNFLTNVNKRLAYVRGNDVIYKTLTESVAYLASVSSQEIRDVALLDACKLVTFVASQLKRCQDYDNMLAYISLLPLISDLMAKLLENDANADTHESCATGDKKTRMFNYLLAVPSSCSAPLRKLAATEFAARDDGIQTGLDILLSSAITLFTLQVEEPDLYSEVMIQLNSLIKQLCVAGGTCHQIPLLFSYACLDMKHGVPTLHAYLDALGQDEYHKLLATMVHYTNALAQDDASKFIGIKSELVNCQNRLYSLKQLLRRDITSFIGGRQHTEKIEELPIPTSLKAYIQTYWDF